MTDEKASLTAEGEGFASPEPRLQYTTVPTPGPGATAVIAPGIHWLRMPMPGDLNHINLWLVEDGDGYTLVDSGLPVPACTAVWEGLEATLLRERPLRRILITHFHPDHMGCAGWLQQRHGMPVRMAARSQPVARTMMEGPSATQSAAMAAYFNSHGMPDAEAFAARLASLRLPTAIARMPEVTEPLRAAEVIDAGSWQFEVIECEGHAVAHQCFYSREPALLISGDQVLPTISPNISLGVADWGRDPLGEFLDSLQRFERLPAETLVLPSHGRPFRGLRERAADLRAHHHEHLALLRDRLATPHDAFALMPALFGRRLSGLHQMLGLHECIAHLEHLVRREEASRETGADGIHRYLRR